MCKEIRGIKSMPVFDRPQEKMIKFGSENLSNAELLALIIRTGSRDKTSIDLCQEILNFFNKDKNDTGNSLSNLRDACIKDFMQIRGIGESKACMLMAAIALANRINIENFSKKQKITSPSKIVKYIMPEMKNLKIEEFRIVNLNTKKEIDSIRTISKGIINATIVHPREVFKTAIDERAHSIILLHNHPSGDPSPSNEDIRLTKKMVEIGKIIDIEVIDHIVIGNERYYSFLENGLI